MLNEKNTNNSKNLQTSLRSFRRAFTLIVILNMVFVIEHTVIDFMGFMFGMIIADLAYLLFLVVGLFGAYQYRVNYIVICTLISLGWIAWNIFVICVYLNIGFLNRYDPFVLNLSTGKKSWFFTSSFGCRTEITAELEQIQLKDQLNAVRTLIEASSTTQSTLAAKLTSSVDFDASSLLPLSQNGYRYMENFIHSNCLVPFYLIEIIHSGLFIFLGIFCVIFGLLLSNTFNEDDDTFDYIGGFDTPHVISSTYNSDHQSHHQITLPRNGLIRLDPIYV